jgi:hypothetical protein
MEGAVSYLGHIMEVTVFIHVHSHKMIPIDTVFSHVCPTQFLWKLDAS